MSQLGMMGASLAGSTIGYGLNQLQADQQAQRQRELMELQMRNQERLNRQGSELQYDMWKKTNYPAQIEMLKKAGLNPALLYGKSGGQGATTGSQSGGSATGGSTSLAMPMDIGNLGSELANIKLIEAQIDKTNAETKEILEGKLPKMGAELDLIYAQVDNEETRNDLLKLDGLLKKSEDQKNWATIANINAETENILLDKEIKENSKKALIGKNFEEWNNLIIDKDVKKQGIKLSETQQRKLKADVRLGFENLNLNKIETALSKAKTQTDRIKILSDIIIDKYDFILKEKGYELQKNVEQTKALQNMLDMLLKYTVGIKVNDTGSGGLLGLVDMITDFM